MRPVSLWTMTPSPPPETEGLPPTFCGKDCQDLLCPKPGSPPKLSASYNKKKPGKKAGPAKLQIEKSLRSAGDMFCRLEYIELCVGDGQEGRKVGAPYVLWQIRSITSQNFLDFYINDKFEPLECVWTCNNPHMNMFLDDSAAREKISSLLQNVLILVLEKIGYKQLDLFIADNLP